MINLKFARKRGQAEIIVSVLLILIGIAAVGFVGMFLMNMIKGNLQQTDCFKTTGQLNLNLGYTFFNSSNKITYVSIQRGSADFNLTGVLITVGTSQSSKGITVKAGNAANLGSTGGGSAMLTSAGVIDTVPITMPSVSETISYAINSTYSSVNLVSITPILKDGKVCDKVDEKDIKTVL